MFDDVDCVIDINNEAASNAEICLEISYFTVIQAVCLSDSEVIDLLKNVEFEFSVIFES